MSDKPKFRFKNNGEIDLKDSPAALKCIQENRNRKPSSTADTFPSYPREDPGMYSGFNRLLFGQLRGSTFKFTLENSTGFSAFLVAEWELEEEGGKDWSASTMPSISENKKAFRWYVNQQPELRGIIRLRKLTEQANSRAKASGDDGLKLVSFEKWAEMTWADICTSSHPEHRSYLDNYVSQQTPNNEKTSMAMLQAYMKMHYPGRWPKLSTSSSAVPSTLSALPLNVTVPSSVVSLPVTSSMITVPPRQLNMVSVRPRLSVGKTRITVPPRLPKTSVPPRLPKTSVPPRLPKTSVPPRLPKTSVPARLPKTSVPARLPKTSVPPRLPFSSGVSAKSATTTSVATHSAALTVTAGATNTAASTFTAVTTHTAVSSPTAADTDTAALTVTAVTTLTTHTAVSSPTAADTDTAALTVTAVTTHTAVDTDTAALTVTAGATDTALSSLMSTELSHCSPLIPKPWQSGIPPQDQHWLGKALFCLSRRGEPELRSDLHSFWYRPPEPPRYDNEPPRNADQFFRSRFFLWAPYHMYRVLLRCPHEECNGKKLISCGYYSTIRKVLDETDFYYMGTEYLQCKTCKRKVAAWHPGVQRQLDTGTRNKFPAILTYHYACDKNVYIPLRERGLGNSASKAYHKLVEKHTLGWVEKESSYHSICKFYRNNPLSSDLHFPKPPVFDVSTIPKPAWLLNVYCRDVVSRMEEIKASITSVYGRILKFDGTKKVTRKLAGPAEETAAWLTNIGNEKGQVLVSVLTIAEHGGLKDMAMGLAKRYADAGKKPPAIMYVDKDCCSYEETSLTAALFSYWPNLCVRLDVWHFMRRIAVCACTEAHPLYGFFMRRLSACIFEWDADDVAALIKARRAELLLEEIKCDSDSSVLPYITWRQFALHCRRRTRGADITRQNITELLRVFSSPDGSDALGVILLDKEKTDYMWRKEQKHVDCIQDPPEDPNDIKSRLYRKIGSVMKGGVELPKFRCARGSTSLESFHLHVNRFIPGERASAARFHAYLLEGVQRWNEDRAQQALSKKRRRVLHCYSPSVVSGVERRWTEIHGHALDPNYKAPRPYTGELLGIEYLFSQTGKVLPSLNDDPDDPEAQAKDFEVEDSEVDEGLGEDLSSPEQAELEELSKLPGPPASVIDVVILPGSSSSSHPVPQRSRTSGISEVEVVEVMQITAADLDGVVEEGEGTRNELTEAGGLPDGSDSNEHKFLIADNTPSYDALVGLADALVALRSMPYLSDAAADHVIRLYNALDEKDKRRVKYQPRYKTRQVQGRYKNSKSSCVAGTDSVNRCIYGSHTISAQWPNTSRLVEAVVLNLCKLHKSSTRRTDKKGSKSRWQKITEDYAHIREVVLTCQRFVEHKTTLQLFEITQKTVTQWYDERASRLSVDMLTCTVPGQQSGYSLSSTPVPPHLSESDAETDEESILPPMTFVEPENTRGQAPKRKHNTPAAAVGSAATALPATAGYAGTTLPAAAGSAATAVPAAAGYAGTAESAYSTLPAAAGSASNYFNCYFPDTASAAAFASIAFAAPAPPPSLPKATAYRAAKRQELGLEPVNKRSRLNNLCRTCNQPKLKETGHSCLYGYTYCPASGEDKEAWKAEAKMKNGAKRLAKEPNQ